MIMLNDNTSLACICYISEARSNSWRDALRIGLTWHAMAEKTTDKIAKCHAPWATLEDASVVVETVTPIQWKFLQVS